MSLDLQGVWYSYRHAPVLQGVDLSLAEGEIVGLIGPNGAGKSTLLKCINGILRPSRGRVLLRGRDIAAYPRRDLASLVSYVPQQSGPALSLPVVDMVALGRAPHRGRATAAHDRAFVLDALRAMHLEDLSLRPFSELSGGERQRVLMARALAQDGRIMLLDEPTNALDLRHQLETITLLRAVARQRGLAAVVAIHDLSLASRVADRIVMLSGGRVHAEGAWSDVLTSTHLEAVYGVGAVIGTDRTLPYIIPIDRTTSP